MAFDVVKQIIDIEKEGEQLVKDAQLRSAVILKEAQSQADSIVQKAAKEAEEYYNSMVQEFETKATESSKSIFENSQLVNEKLKEIPEEKLDKALNMVIERIVNSHGDS